MTLALMMIVTLWPVRNDAIFGHYPRKMVKPIVQTYPNGHCEDVGLNSAWMSRYELVEKYIVT